MVLLPPILFKISLVAFFKFLDIDFPTFSPDVMSVKVLTPAFKADFLACLINFLPVLLETALDNVGIRKLSNGLKKFVHPSENTSQTPAVYSFTCMCRHLNCVCD